MNKVENIYNSGKNNFLAVEKINLAVEKTSMVCIRCCWQAGDVVQNKFNDRKEDPCTICFEKFKDKDHVELPYLCGEHFFHAGCASEWNKQKEEEECPVCKKKGVKDKKETFVLDGGKLKKVLFL